MKIDKKMCKVLADLEYLVGSECYNPNSYDGWNEIEGCSFRYPVNVPSKDGEFTKVRSNINSSCMISEDQISEDTIPYIKYKFGSNELFIGRALIGIMEYMEERYGISFNELEKNIEK